MVHSWSDSFKRGNEGEEVLDGWLLSTGVGLDGVGMEQQRQGIDRILTTQDGRLVTLEYKTDYRAVKTGNAYIETVSVCKDGVVEKRGWVHTTQAEWVLYFTPGTTEGTVYALKPDRLREELDRWQDTYRTVTVQNKGYSGAGILVPLTQLKEIASWCRSMAIRQGS